MHAPDHPSQLGQLFMVGIPQPTLDNETRSLLQELRPSGIILFRRNYTGPAALAVLCTELHSLFSSHRLLVALDHEGGRVHRVSPPFTHFPPAMRIGQTGSVALAYRVGLAMGHELRRVGIDIDFAPALDVLTNPANTVIGDRAFSSDPYQVALFGRALIRGLRESGVIPCGKHFPGHGGTLMDSHEDLPQDDRTREELASIDVYPFQQALGEGIAMLMTAHVRYPALDLEFPATISSKIITGLLRQQMHYDGVVVTDDLEMGAVVRHSTVAQTVINALNAGADMMLVCHTIELAIAARDACLQALENGTLSHQRVEEAAQRINALRQSHQSRQELSPPPKEYDYALLVEEILRIGAS
ncbi:MAG: beta-N-acetylhexosaminidase [Deltaproteobacteria bacterium]|nr:beta-N-acetylhexosaminidase [Deltaproteobacteria bacterium]